MGAEICRTNPCPDCPIAYLKDVLPEAAACVDETFERHNQEEILAALEDFQLPVDESDYIFYVVHDGEGASITGTTHNVGPLEDFVPEEFDVVEAVVRIARGECSSRV